MNRLSTIAKTIGMITLVALIAVPLGIALAEIQDNPWNAADSLRQAERPYEVPLPIDEDQPPGPLPPPIITGIELCRFGGPPSIPPIGEPVPEIGERPEGAPAGPVRIIGEPVPEIGERPEGAPAGHVRIIGEPVPEIGERPEGAPAWLVPEGATPEQEVGIGVVRHISQRWLGVGLHHQWGPYFFHAGDIVVISMAWTPWTSSMDLGVVFQPTGEFISFIRTEGAGTARIQIFAPGNFYIRVHNRGPHGIWYCGYYNI